MEESSLHFLPSLKHCLSSQFKREQVCICNSFSRCHAALHCGPAQSLSAGFSDAFWPSLTNSDKPTHTHTLCAHTYQWKVAPRPNSDPRSQGSSLRRCGCRTDRSSKWCPGKARCTGRLCPGSSLLSSGSMSQMGPWFHQHGEDWQAPSWSSGTGLCLQCCPPPPGAAATPWAGWASWWICEGKASQVIL